MRRRHVALAALACAVGACSATRHAPPASTHLSAAAAIRIANAAADRAHMHRFHYAKPEARLDAAGTLWHVSYGGTSDLLDDCFSVDVNDRTGVAVVYICA